MAQRTETGYEARSGYEAEDFCWLEEALSREAAFEEESRASFAGPDHNPLDSGTPTICSQCGASFDTEGQYR